MKEKELRIMLVKKDDALTAQLRELIRELTPEQRKELLEAWKEKEREAG